MSDQLIFRIMGTVLFGTMWLGAFGLSWGVLALDDLEACFHPHKKKTEEQQLRADFWRAAFSFCCTFPFYAWLMYEVWLTDRIIR